MCWRGMPGLLKLQLSPVNPGRQRHAKPFSSSIHCPCTHGKLSHSSISVEKTK